MLRRIFLATLPAFLLSEQLFGSSGSIVGSVLRRTPKPCSAQERNLAQKKSHIVGNGNEPIFTPIIPLTVQVDFVETYMGSRTMPWTDDQKSRVTQAAAIFQKVWGSQEFKAKVTALPPLVYEDPKTVSGAELYTLLTKVLDKQMKLSVSKNWWNYHVGGELNASSRNGQTRIQIDYLDKPTTTVADLVNSLSHESTHYDIEGWSWDRGHSDLHAYVSYGIGCLTQNMAFPKDQCNYDASDPNSTV